MPQFWKISLGKKKPDDRPGSPDSLKSPSKVSIANGRALEDGITEELTASSGHKFGPLQLLAEEDAFLGDIEKANDDVSLMWNPHSRLSKTLSDVLHDKAALGYFLQYLEYQGGSAYVKFWLDAESFHEAAASHTGSPLKSRGVLESCVDESADTIVKDAIQIFQKYVAKDASHGVGISDESRCTVVSKICTEDGVLDPNCFVELQETVIGILEKEYFQDFLRSDYHCKHQIDVLTSGKVFLADILYNESALFHFMEFMEQEGQRSLVDFWFAADNFRQHYASQGEEYDTHEAQNDAMIIYDRYFSLQATCPLGFSDKVRFEVEQQICREGGPLANCLDWPLRITFHILDKNFLPTFLTSQLYLGYLSELINTIQTSSSLLGRKRSGSDSTCSSEASLTVQNTLLAMDGLQPGVASAVRRVDTKQMTIDSQQLCDPDSLWRRRHMSKLSIGRINDLGKFETEIEPEPDKKVESRFSKAMKRLVNLEEDKTKEEIAWQVAEMIVKDITNVTLGSSTTVPDPDA